MSTITYDVADISCGHCEAAISAEVCALPGVDTIEVDLESKRVAVIRAAIYDAGYEAVRV